MCKHNANHQGCSYPQSNERISYRIRVCVEFMGMPQELQFNRVFLLKHQQVGTLDKNTPGSLEHL